MTRGERRQRTETVAHGRASAWASFGYAVRPVGHFAKARPLGCKCRKGRGMCSRPWPDGPGQVARRESRRIEREERP